MFSSFSKSLNLVAPSASANNIKDPLLLMAPFKKVIGEIF
jgi:hypothetical protein